MLRLLAPTYERLQPINTAAAGTSPWRNFENREPHAMSSLPFISSLLLILVWKLLFLIVLTTVAFGWYLSAPYTIGVSVLLLDMDV